MTSSTPNDAPSRLRVALVSPYGLDRFGGVRSHIQGLGEALQTLGHNVEVIAPGGDGRLGTLRVIGCGKTRVMHFGGTHFDIAWASAAALKKVIARGYDVMHLHTPWNPALPLQLARRFHGARVGTFHDVPGESTPFWARKLMPVASSAIRKVFLHATIAVSAPVSEYLGANTHDVIPNGVAVPLPADRQSGDDERTAAFVYVGRLEPRKDVACLLRALTLLSPPAPRVLIIGDGPSRMELEALRDELKLASVQFIGAVSEAEKWAHLRSARAVVAPSRSGESFGIVLLEAMAAGAIPIAASNPGYRDVLAHGGESLLYPVGDAAALAARLQRVLFDAGWYSDMKRWSAQHWPQYAWNDVAERVLNSYRLALVRAAA